MQELDWIKEAKVSTHSRPKAAGPNEVQMRDLWDSFNTQPPEGGWGDTILKT